VNIPTRERILSVFTTIFFLLAAIVIIYFIYLFINPHSFLNPLPPPRDKQPAEVSAIGSETPRSLETTQPEVTQTSTPFGPATIPAATVTNTAALLPSATLNPTEDPNRTYSFGLLGDPLPVIAAEYSPNKTCDWAGVGGAIFDLEGLPVKGIRIELSGQLGETLIDLVTLSGTALVFGPSGYEFTLGGNPIAAQGIMIRLVDHTGLPLSAPVYFDTFDSCDQNLILIDFKQVQ
jgi:hypothetical protein